MKGTMTCQMKISLTPAIVLLLAACSLGGCSGSSAPTDGSGSGDDSGSKSSGDDSGSTTSKGDGGKGSTDDGGNSACTIAADWANNSPGPACDTCVQKNCCGVIQDCSNDTGCKAIYDCQTNCYSGVGLDGGQIDQDGGAVDDAGDSAEDLCAQACIALQSQASQALFASQDNCVNGTAANQCGAAAVCD
jgi:hypothetical protein